VQLLTDQTAVFLTQIIELEAKYPDKSAREKIAEEDLAIIKQTSQEIRFLIYKSYIDVNTLKSKLKLNETFFKDIDSLYKKINKQLVIELEDADNFLIKMKSVCMNTILQNMLVSSNDIIQKVFRSQEKQNVNNS